ncbi:isochorismatase family protein [Azoarcus sp. L1K30]|uniref:isochorismatase family protein n=1 Tax=Azoarcus sp. L1K30 TaxID=2820277 RepID=UPI001B8320D2|nr:isochorismatase family protein [Azoarcus sp. L1K30]MBR0566045.1 isochorismatase family protein [Azoarcus sp. L1K30]
MMSMLSTDRGLLTPTNCALVLIDHQSWILAGMPRAATHALLTALETLAVAARLNNLPVIISALSGHGFDGRIAPELLDLFPHDQPILRTRMNAWQDPAFVDAAGRMGRQNFVVAALLSEACLVFPAMQMLDDGYGVYAIDDASHGTTLRAHDNALRRIAQAGGVAITAFQLMLELACSTPASSNGDDIVRRLHVHHPSKRPS